MALAAMVATDWFAAGIAVIHMLRPDLDPASHTISEYALGRYGPVQAMNFLAAAIGSITLALALRRTVRHPGRAGPLLLGLWAVAEVVEAFVHADGNGPATTAGAVHPFVSILGFALGIAAMFVLARRFGQDPAWRSFRRPTPLWPATAIATFVLIPLLGAARPGTGQRIFAAVLAAWLVETARRLYVLGPSSRRIPPRPQPNQGDDMNKRLFAIALAGLTLFGLAAPSSALAATGNQSFTDFIQGKLTADGPTPTHTIVVANGVINAVGTDEFAPSQPGDPENVDRDIFRFPKGTLSVKVTNVAGTGGPPNPRTCVGRFTQSGTWDIVGGTGAYAGASGTLTFSLHGTLIAKPLPGGGCSNDDATFIIVISATGSVTVPSQQSSVQATKTAA